MSRCLAQLRRFALSAGFVWDREEAQWEAQWEALWEAAYQELVAYKKEQGHCNVPRSYQTKDGFSLGTWVNNQRAFKKRGELSPERIQRLEAVGFFWISRKALPK
jgi:hypothetical protein